MDKFDQIKIGDQAELTHIITQEDIKKFVELTGDDNKLHVDETYAGKTSFKKTVAHGMLGASFISTIIGTKIPGDGALWFAQTIEFLLPVRIADELTIKATVIKKNEQLRIIEIQTDIFNQHKQKVTAGIAKVKIVEQEKDVLDKVNKNPHEKNVLVIGGTGGIGTATCIQLATEGYNVAIHYHQNKDKAQKILQTVSTNKVVKACVVSGDITSTRDIKEIIEQANRKIGYINILINCSTLKLPTIKFGDLQWEDIQNHIDLNVKSNFLLAKELIPLMKEKRQGKLVFITSQVTENVPPPEWAFYTIAKYALNGFAKSLAVEMAPFNINVNLVSPGMTETNLISDIPEKTKLVLAAKSPLRRLAKPDDIAKAIIFLVSDNANYITGETIRVNGGQIML